MLVQDLVNLSSEQTWRLVEARNQYLAAVQQLKHKHLSLLGPLQVRLMSSRLDLLMTLHSWVPSGIDDCEDPPTKLRCSLCGIAGPRLPKVIWSDAMPCMVASTPNIRLPVCSEGQPAISICGNAHGHAQNLMGGTDISKKTTQLELCWGWRRLGLVSSP